MPRGRVRPTVRRAVAAPVRPDLTDPDVLATAEAFLASPLAQFAPWEWDGRSPQRELLRGAARHRVRIFRGGNRTGKTVVGSVDTVLRLLGWHPHARQQADRPPWIWAVGLDWEFGVGQVLWPAVKRVLPPREVRNVVWYRKQEPSIASTVILKNGARLDFKSADAGREKFQGASLDAVWLDEEIPPDVVEEIRMRLVDRAGDLLLTLTPVRREPYVRRLERESGTLVVEASTLDAARAGVIDLRAVEVMAETLPERQREVRILGKHAQAEGLVYPEFSRARNVVTPRGGRLVTEDGRDVAPWPIPDDWQRFAAIDFGYSNPTAIVVSAVNPASDRVVVERVYKAPGVRGTVWAEFIQRNLPPLTSPLVADHDADERAEFAVRGIPTEAARKDVIPGLECVERFIGPAGQTPRLFLVVDDPAPTSRLTGRCDAMPLVQELEEYSYPKRRGEDAPDRKDLPEKRNDHACLAAETPILTRTGYSPVGDVGVLVVRDSPMLCVTFDGGYIRCTPDHWLLTTRGWVAAEDLRIGDHLVRHEESHRRVGRGSGLQWSAVSAEQLLLPGQRETAASRGVEGRAWSDSVLGAGASSRSRPAEQPAVQPRRGRWPEAPVGAHDAGEAKGVYGAAASVRDSRSGQVARIGGGACVAPGAWAGNVGGQEVHPSEVLRLRRAIRDVVPCSLEVLRRYLQGSGAPGSSRAAAAGMACVTGVRADGRADAFDVLVPDSHAYVAAGVVSHNCDALRYLLVHLEDWCGGTSPGMTDLEAFGEHVGAPSSAIW